MADVYDQLLTQAEVQEQVSIVNGECVNEHIRFYPYELAREKKKVKIMILVNFIK